MNPLLSSSQLQEVFIEKSYALFYQIIVSLKKNNVLSSTQLSILDKLFSTSSPQVLAKPEIFYRCLQIQQNPTQYEIDHLFFELTFIIAKIQEESISFSTNSTIYSTHISEPLPSGEYELYIYKNNLYDNNSSLYIPIAQKFQNFYLGALNLSNDIPVEKNPSKEIFDAMDSIPTEALYTIKALISTIVVLQQTSENQISFSHPHMIGMVFIQNSQSILFCDSLIHETMHNEFDLLQSIYKFLENDENEEKYYSAVISKPRPLINCLLALHAFIPLEEYYFNLYINTKDELAAQRLFTQYYKNKELLSTLNNHAQFTSSGKKLFDYFNEIHLTTTQNIKTIQEKFKEIDTNALNSVQNHKKDVIEKYPDILC